MPQKLQVDESFAFLFMCIEASGCKLDFKLVGDATDLQPAAARMRYSRLKKAVEAGHFKGAVLTQPISTSPQLAALANPESRRLGNAAVAGGTSKSRRAAKPRQNAQAKAFAGDDEEEEEEEVEEVESQLTLTSGRSRRKRQASNMLPEDIDSDMFYPDTSQATRRTKQIKRSDSDVETEEQEELEETDQQASIASTSTTSSRPRTQNVNTGRPISNASRSPHTEQQEFGNATYAPASSRRKVSAANAAESAYALGLATGRHAPSPEDLNSPQFEHAARLRNISTGVNPIAKTGYNTSGPSKPGMRQLNDRDRQFLARHGQPTHPMVSSPLAQNAPYNSFGPPTGGLAPIYGQNNTRSTRMPAPSIPPFGDPFAIANTGFNADAPASATPQRHHHTYDAASVFDDFSPPVDPAARFARPSTKTSPAKRTVSKARVAPTTRRNNTNTNANIDPQLTVSPPMAPATPVSSPQHVIQSRQVPRAVTSVPETQLKAETENGNASERGTPVSQSHAQAHAQTQAQAQAHTAMDRDGTVNRPRSTAPSATASELEIAEMLQGLKQGSAAPNNAANSNGNADAVSIGAAVMGPGEEARQAGKGNGNESGNENEKQDGSAYPDLH